MKIAVTSEDFRTVTPHAGHTRHFLVFEADSRHDPVEVERLELPEDAMIRSWDGEGPHPLDAVEVLIAGSFGEPFRKRMASRGIVAVSTNRKDPVEAVRGLFEAGGLRAFEA